MGRYLVARVVEELQPLVDVFAGAEQVEQLLVVDLQQRHFDGELGAVLRKLLEDLVQSPGDDAGQRVLSQNTGGCLESANALLWRNMMDSGPPHRR